VKRTLIRPKEKADDDDRFDHRVSAVGRRRCRRVVADCAGLQARARTNPRQPLRRASRDESTSASGRVNRASSDDGNSLLTGVIVGSMLFGGDSHARPPADADSSPDSAGDSGNDSDGSIGGDSDGGFETGGDF
jgi:hypothetical protein